MIDLLRRLKRRVLTRGFARTVNEFLKDVERGSGVFKHPDDSYLVNLSFDFEFGFGTTFWEGDIEKAISYGKTARQNFVPIMKYLNQENIPANVQTVGGLFDPTILNLPIFNEEQKAMMTNHRNLFKLNNEDLELLKALNIETGIHGFSHRHFDTLSIHDAEYEVLEAIRNFDKNFNRKPEFMSFPKNRVAHTHMIRRHGIKSWRSNSQHPENSAEIPLGHWFAPGVLGKGDLKRLLMYLKNRHNGFLLHLWGHFTEMDMETFKSLIDVIRDAGWDFITVKNFKKY